MQWWNDFVDWTSSDSGGRLISDVLVPFVAIVVAGVVAALIGRGATKRVVSLQEREAKNAAVAGIVSAARKAATWGSLTHDERSYADHLAEDADVRLRLLPVPGAPTAANWAQHEIADIKKHSSTFSFQADQSLAEFRDRILEWQARPARARKLFKSDLERWKFESPDPDADLIARQQEWNADQAERKDDTPSTTSLRGGAGASSGAAPVRPGDAPARQPGDAPVGGTATRPGGTADPVASLRPALPTPTPAVSAPTPDQQATRPYGDASSTQSSDRTAPTDRSADHTSGDRGPDSAPTDRYDSALPTDRYDSAQQATRYDARTTVPYGSRNTTVPLSGGRGSAGPDHSGGSDVPAVGQRSGQGPDGEDGQGRLDSPRVDATATSSTTSIPTRMSEAPAEPADAHETDESTHTQPISASELRRRSEDDDD